MKASCKPRIRKILRGADEGLTVRQVANLIGVDSNSVYSALKAMPDAYIDRWDLSDGRVKGSNWMAVWCVVTPPENCPHPARKPKKEELHDLRKSN